MKGIDEDTALVYDKLRETAFNIYEQYLSEKSQHKLQVHPNLVKTLFFRIKNLTDTPSELWFEEVQKHIYQKLKTNDQFLPGFEKSSSYLKLLAELDLLGQTNLEEDVISIGSLENNDISPENSNFKDNPEINILNIEALDKDYLCSENMQRITKHARSYSDVSDIVNVTKIKENSATFKSELSKVDVIVSEADSTNNEEVLKKEEDTNTEEEYHKLKTGNYTLSVDIIEAGKIIFNLVSVFLYRL